MKFENYYQRAVPKQVVYSAYLEFYLKYTWFLLILHYFDYFRLQIIIWLLMNHAPLSISGFAVCFCRLLILRKRIRIIRQALMVL